MATIDPKNLTAQSSFQARGNPPSTIPSSAIANCFPGLEFDFRNIWKHIFVEIELHEARNLVVGVDPTAPANIQQLLQQRIVLVDGQNITVPVTGPALVGGPTTNLGQTNMEWGNVLAAIVPKGGSQVLCTFVNQSGQPTSATLTVRRVFDHDLAGNTVTSQRAVFAKEIVEPGALTQSLCSPWQNDFLECACYYWAASRPDMVNAELKADGTTDGNNWIEKDRQPNTTAEYTLRQADLVDYEDLFKNWENELKFVIGGKDEDRQ